MMKNISLWIAVLAIIAIGFGVSWVLFGDKVPAQLLQAKHKGGKGPAFDIYQIVDIQNATENVIERGHNLGVEFAVADPTRLDCRKSKLEIFDLAGKMVGRGDIICFQYTFEPVAVAVSQDTSQFAAGLYFLKLTVCNIDKKCAAKVSKFVISPTRGAPVGRIFLSGDTISKSRRVQIAIHIPTLPPIIPSANGTAFEKCELQASDSLTFQRKLITKKFPPTPQTQIITLQFPQEGIKWLKAKCVDSQGLTYASIPKYVVISSKRDYLKDDYIDLLFVPMGFRKDQEEEFRIIAQAFFYHFLEKTPFSEKSSPKVKLHVLKPKDCKWKLTPWLMDDALGMAFDCALKSKHRNSFDFVQAICRSCSTEAYFFGGYALLAAQGLGFDIPFGLPSVVFLDAPFGDEVSYAQALKNTSIHEFGHSFGFLHINAGCGEANTCGGMNSADCQLSGQDRRLDLMSYCPERERFGPAGYHYLKNILFRDYLK